MKSTLIRSMPLMGFVLVFGAADIAMAQVANPAEQQQGTSKKGTEPGMNKLGGTMPPNTGVPAMTPGAQQPASAGTTQGLDGKLTRNNDAAPGASTPSDNKSESSSPTMAK